MMRCATVFCLLVLPGCFISRSVENEPIVAPLVATLQPGQTTARDVVERLGAPTEVVQLGKGSAYRFDALVVKRAAFSIIILTLVNEDARSDRVWAFFDEDNVLTHYGVTLASHRPQYAMPWEDVHEEADRRSADDTRRGLELIRK